MLDLLNITPHQVSRDLRGYSVLMYGEPKSGKTTVATKFPKHLLFAFEKGYSTLAGVMVQPINKWTEFKKALKQLESEEVRKTFETIIIDTADISYDYCEKYICSIYEVDTIGAIPYGQGYSLVKKEFDECLRKIVQLNYGLVLISHSIDKTFTNEQGVEYNQIVPTLPNQARLVCQRMCDIIGYSRSIETSEGITTKFFMRGTPRYVAGSRFKHTPEVIDFSYSNLVKAISDAIDKQMKEDGAELFTESRENVHKESTAKVDFDEVLGEFNDIVNGLMSQNADYFKPRITEIIEKHLGKGRKVSECSRDQADLIDLIIYEIKNLK